MTDALPGFLPEELFSDCFVALDFETADQGPDSACALALIKVRNNAVIEEKCFLIRPPRSRFLFTHIHRITWEDVRDHPDFAGWWPEITQFLQDADFLVAHNASFDRRVLNACCQMIGHPPLNLPFYCTVQLSRKIWTLASNALPMVCRHLGLSLNHHEARSDALACANIVLSARRQRGPLGLPWKPINRSWKVKRSG